MNQSRKIHLGLIAVACVVILSGCAAPATGFRSSDRDVRAYLAGASKVPAGKARLVVYAYQGLGSGWNHSSGFFTLNLNDKRIFSNLGNTRYDSSIVDAGPAKISAGGEGDIGDCVQNYFLPPGETTFIKISVREAARGAQAVFGLLGALIESAASKAKDDCGGYYKTELVPAEEAISEITKLGN